MATPKKNPTEKFVKEIRQNTHRIFTAEQKILMVMEGLRAETSVAEICRNHNITQSQFYAWNKEFMEAGKKRLNGDVAREAMSRRSIRSEEGKCTFERDCADLVVRYDIVKKSLDRLD